MYVAFLFNAFASKHKNCIRGHAKIHRQYEQKRTFVHFWTPFACIWYRRDLKMLVFSVWVLVPVLAFKIYLIIWVSVLVNTVIRYRPVPKKLTIFLNLPTNSIWIIYVQKKITTTMIHANNIDYCNTKH